MGNADVTVLLCVQFRAMVSIDDLWEVVHGLLKETIIGLLKSNTAEICHLVA